MNEWQLSWRDERLLNQALQEDLSFPVFDVTTETLFPNQNNNVKVRVVSKHPTPFVLSGMPIVRRLVEKFSYAGKLQLEEKFQDGDLIQSGEVIFFLTGPNKIILMIERTLLNFVQHLSAIATTTRSFVDKVTHTQLKILDTRKTTPGFRHLDKYAVTCGGGVNHRDGLYDVILIKDNHIDALGGVEKVLQQLPAGKQYFTIIEIRNIEELKIILNNNANKIDRVLLDNMNLIELKECVTLCKGKILTEASGNISLDNIVEVAETGVDYASIGRLTHSLNSIDMSMQVV